MFCPLQKHCQYSKNHSDPEVTLQGKILSYIMNTLQVILKDHIWH